MAMSYKEAIELVWSLVPRPPDTRSIVPDMIRFLHRIGYKVSDLDKLNILHLTGTKGKGSTLLFCESILRHHGVKTGAFISPSLVEMRERYRFNGEPVSEELFTQHVFDIYDKLQKTKESETDMPPRFGFIALLGFDLFLKHGVEALVLEVGFGGEFDWTNVISAPVVCGVSSIHLHHVRVLGNTVQSIAWHKSGIFKPGAPAVTVPQSEGILPVLQSRATERGTILIMTPPLDDYESEQPIKLGLAGDVQKQNASLAIQMCKIWRDIVHPGMPSTILKDDRKGCGMEEKQMKVLAKITPNLKLTATELKDKSASSKANSYIIRHADATYFVDTAHTDVSIKAYADWFIARTNEEKQKRRGRVTQVSIFNSIARESDPLDLVRHLAKVPFDVTLFCPIGADDGRRVESLFPVASTEKQMQWSIEANDEWIKCQGHDCENKGDHSQTPTLSFVVPSLKDALALATCGKDGGYLNKEVTQRTCDEFPKASETIRSGDQVHIMIVGGPQVAGQSLIYLEKSN